LQYFVQIFAAAGANLRFIQGFAALFCSILCRFLQTLVQICALSKGLLHFFAAFCADFCSQPGKHLHSLKGCAEEKS